ncbi:MAG: phosphatidylglycerophosphatase A [Rickettsiales bacterium]
MTNKTISKLPINKIWWWIATWFGSGLAPKASGTFGTIAALPFAWLTHFYCGGDGLFFAAIIIFFVGWWASNKYMKYYPEKHDPKQIVVDEVAGIWLLLSILPITWQGYAIAFLLFRFFDVLKPWPISIADRKIKGGFGVMFDDILAAIYPIIITIILLFIGYNLFPTHLDVFLGESHCDENYDNCDR